MKNKYNSGSILPIVLVVVIVTQIMILGILRVYDNQMESYFLLIDHYQSQTLLSLSEVYLKEQPETKTMQYNLGQVEINTIDKKSLKLTSTLNSGYQEARTILKD